MGEVLGVFFPAARDFLSSNKDMGDAVLDWVSNRRFFLMETYFYITFVQDFPYFDLPKFLDLLIAQIWFLLQGVAKCVLLMYYKYKAKFCLSNKCVLWQYLFYCFANLNSLVLNMKRKRLSRDCLVSINKCVEYINFKK